MRHDNVRDLIGRASRTLASLVIAVVFGCGLVHLLGMLAVYGWLLVQGEPMQIHPGILAGAMWIGAMQGASALPVVIILGWALHLLLMRSGKTGIAAYIGAALLVTAASALFLGLLNGFAFNTAFAVMAVASGVLGGCLFWLGRSPGRT
jgi:hypothetical protein